MGYDPCTIKVYYSKGPAYIVKRNELKPLTQLGRSFINGGQIIGLTLILTVISGVFHVDTGKLGHLNSVHHVERKGKRSLFPRWRTKLTYLPCICAYVCISYVRTGGSARKCTFYHFLRRHLCFRLHLRGTCELDLRSDVSENSHDDRLFLTMKKTEVTFEMNWTQKNWTKNCWEINPVTDPSHFFLVKNKINAFQ